MSACKRMCLPAVFWLASLPFSVSAWDWPVATVNVAESFAENTGAGFSKGMYLAGTNLDVRPVEAGEVVFTVNSAASSGGVPSALGTFVAVDSEQGYRTLYGSLAPGSPLPTGRVTPADTIGRTGQSGMVSRDGLRLEIIDQRGQQLVNPEVVLPPHGDSSKPVITAIYLVSETPNPLSDGLVVEHGRWQIEIDVHDVGRTPEGAVPIAPYRFSLTVNDKPIFAQQFERLSYRAGDYYIDAEYRWGFANLYSDLFRYDLGIPELPPGDNNLSVTVTDYSGNAATATRKFTVVEPAQ